MSDDGGACGAALVKADRVRVSRKSLEAYS